MTSPFLTTKFWMTIVTTVLLMAVALGAISQETSDDIVRLVEPFIVAVLPLVAYILGQSYVRAQAVQRGLLAADKPKWLTDTFWMTIIGTGLMVAVALGLDQMTADTWLAMAGPLVAAVLPIVAYLLGLSYEEAAAVR